MYYQISTSLLRDTMTETDDYVLSLRITIVGTYTLQYSSIYVVK